MEAMLELLGHPEAGYPIVHVAGTNGKSSTVWMVASLIEAMGLTAGTFVSPHLDRVEERYGLGTTAMTPAEFAGAVSDLAPFVDLFEAGVENGPTYFELTVLAAYTWFAARAVDVGVVEVGLGGRLDATNVAPGSVSVVTSIGLDHMEYLGDTVAAIAAEKLAIVAPGGVLVTGSLPGEAEAVAAEVAARLEVPWHRFGLEFRLDEDELAVGGRLVTIDGIHGRYQDIFLPLHGRYQSHNFAVAVAATEELFGRALDPEAVTEAAAAIATPGRTEVVSRHPLVVVDGAHNAPGLEILAAVLDEEFLVGEWVLVVGMRGDRDAASLLVPFRDQVRHVVATAPNDPAAGAPEVIAAGARAALGEDVSVEVVPGAAAALLRAIEVAGSEGNVVVTGSLYLVGEARGSMGLSGSSPVEQG